MFLPIPGCSKYSKFFCKPLTTVYIPAGSWLLYLFINVPACPSFIYFQIVLLDVPICTLVLKTFNCVHLLSLTNRYSMLFLPCIPGFVFLIAVPASQLQSTVFTAASSCAQLLSISL